MNERRVGGSGGLRHRLGAGRHHGVETLVAALEQDTDQIDYGVRVAHRRRDRIRIAQIGLHRLDLADPAHRPQVTTQFRPAHRDPDPVAAAGKRPHRMAAEKSRTAEHGDQRFRFALDRHACS